MRSTPFPNRLIDNIMPTLSDTEWRVLCVVVRQTLGWEDRQGGRKQADWLTQSQLKAHTGRASAALSRAIDGLVQKGLIQVRSESGELLNSPQERRRCSGRQLFRLSEQMQEAPQQTPVIFLQNACSLSEEPSSVSEQDYSETEVRKAKTTKERQTKRTLDGVPLHEALAVDKPVDKLPRKKAKAETNPAPDQRGSDVRGFLLAYQEQFARHSARGEPPPVAWGRDGKLVKGLLAQYGYERLLELLTRFFASEDAWVQKRGYALSCFPTLLPTLLMQDGHAQERGCEAQRRALAMHGPSAQHWQQAGDRAAAKGSLFERFPDLQRKVRRPLP